MRRRLPYRNPFCAVHIGLPRRSPILFSLAFALLLTVVVAIEARAQDTMPPAPPPDQQAAPPTADGQSTVRAVRVSDVEGQVQVFQGEQTAFDQAMPNMPAVEGMRFVTGDNGRLEVEFEDGSVARVAPDSSIRLSRLRRNADGSTATEIDALSGLSYYELNSRGGQYSVHFGTSAATPDKDAVFRVALDSSPYQLAVMHGAVHVDEGEGLAVDVHSSQTYQSDPSQPGEYTLAQNITADSWDQWNSDRDSALARLEANESTARASSGNPDNPAWSDLDYYGSWYNLPGYGQVWSPAGVGASWDPFANGAWGYYPAWGYTWISGYPWGWWPYHCGAWDFLPGWGWIWIPGNCGWGLYGAGWFPYSTVWNVPPGYALPLRPHAPVRTGPGPRRPLRLVAVNRGEQYSAPFHFDRDSKPAPRPLAFGGKTIAPMEAGIHPLERGPLGESFTTALVRVHPEMGTAPLHAPDAAAFRGTYAPLTGVRIFGPPPGFGTSHLAGGSAGGSRAGFSSNGASRGSFSSGGAGHAGGFSSGAPAGGGHVGGAAPSGGGGSPHH